MKVEIACYLLALQMVLPATAQSMPGAQTQGADVSLRAMFAACLDGSGDAYRAARTQFVSYAMKHEVETMTFLGDQAKASDFRVRIMSRILAARAFHSDVIRGHLAAMKQYADANVGKSIIGDPVQERLGMYALHADAIMTSMDDPYPILRNIAAEQMWKGPDMDSEFGDQYAAIARGAAAAWQVSPTSDEQRVDHCILRLWLTFQDAHAGKSVANSYYADAWRRAVHPSVVQHLKQWRAGEASPVGQLFLNRLIPGLEARVEGRAYVERDAVEQNPRIDDLRRELLWHERRIADTPRGDTRPGQEQLRDKTQYLHGYLEGRRAAMVKQLDRETDPQERYWLEQALQWMDEEFPQAKARHPLPPPKAASSRRASKKAQP